MRSATDILGNDFKALEDRAADFFRGLSVTQAGRFRDSGVVVIRPDYYWSSPTPAQRREQIALRENLLRLNERLQVFFSTAPPDFKEELSEARKHLLEWVDLDLNWALTDDKEEVERRVRTAFKPLHRAIELLRQGPPDTIVVPDTNAIALTPDPRSYEAIAGSHTFKFVLLPTVLGELDRLKIESRSESFRNRCVGAIKRIKGWRLQGSLIAGVTIDKTITVVAVAAEPDFAASLSWLDANNADDRLVASILELQKRHTAAVVVLVTGDINLQNKAEAAGILWSDLPEIPVADREKA